MQLIARLSYAADNSPNKSPDISILLYNPDTKRDEFVRAHQLHLPPYRLRIVQIVQLGVSGWVALLESINETAPKV